MVHKKGTKLKRFTMEERRGILDDYLKSGLSVKEYCKNAPVSDGTIHRWLKDTNPKKKSKRRQYSSTERKEAVEQYMKSGMDQQTFAQVWGISPKTLSKWFTTYKKDGAKALSNGILYGQGKKRGRKGIKQQVKDKILETKKNLPEHGLKKLRDFMYRFEGVKVAPNTIKKVLKEEDMFNPPLEPAKKKSPPLPRRFERANPMQLWQSDITSYVLKRTGQRVYLVVFKDDHSRYIVSWSLAMKQTGQFVMECFMNGIQKFGKPEETLTDQGRQYFSWRGKSEFQKLLEKEGIRHVVSRSHHPQTLGKCERLWKTVGVEFWDRAKPQDLDEARERLALFINHYNHFRPHQGIGGSTPADRFFGVDSDVREAIEKNLSGNELRLSIDQMPRKPFYFVGQVGEKRVTIHGEKGKLQVNTPDGQTERIDYEDFGSGYAESSRNNEGEQREYYEEKEGQERAPERQLQNASESSSSSEGTVGSSNSGREETRSYESDHHHGILDGPCLEGRSGEDSGDATPTNMAIEPTRDLGDVCRAFKAAENEEGCDEQRRRSEVLKEEDKRSGEDDLYPGEVDRNSTFDAGMQTSDIRGGAEEREGTREESEKEEDEENRSEAWQEAQSRTRDTPKQSGWQLPRSWWNKDDD